MTTNQYFPGTGRVAPSVGVPLRGLSASRQNQSKEHAINRPVRGDSCGNFGSLALFVG